MKNLSRSELIRLSLLRQENEAKLTNKGALVVDTSPHTGRSPDAKYIVEDDITKNLVDWNNNQKMSKETYKKTRELIDKVK